MAAFDFDKTLQKRTVAYKVVGTFARICERRLWLKNGPVASTDGHSIFVPFKDPEFLRLVEHEISHILFKSDTEARQSFIATYSGMVRDAASKSGITLDEDDFENSLQLIIGILEDTRVNSLWGLLYPGSFLRLQKANKNYVEKSIAKGMDPHGSLLSAFMATAVDIDLEDGPQARFKPYFVEALKKVERRGFQATLIVTKWLVTQLVNELIREAKGEDPCQSPDPSDAIQQLLNNLMGDGSSDSSQSGDSDSSEGEESPSGDSSDNSDGGGGKGSNEPSDSSEDGEGKGDPKEGDGDSEEPSDWEPPPIERGRDNRAQGLQDLIDRLGDLPQGLKDRVQDVKDASGPSPGKKRAQHAGQEAAEASLNDAQLIQDILDKSEGEMAHTLAKARLAMRQPITKDDWIKRAALASVNFIDVPIHEGVEDLDPLPVGDTQTIKRLKAQFVRILGRKKSALSDSGNEIDIEALLERRTTGGDTPCFRHEAKGQGFAAVLLVDLSGSMSGGKIVQVERAVQIIRKSLYFPFVKVDVWGFRSDRAGQVDLVRFHPKAMRFALRRQVNGVTPIHAAIGVAIRHLENSDQAKRLFVLTDGYPVFASKQGGHHPTERLQNWVREEVQRGYKKGVMTNAIFVGDGYGRYDLSEKDMSFMYGGPRNWKRVSTDNLGKELIDLVLRNFSTYLRTY